MNFSAKFVSSVAVLFFVAVQCNVAKSDDLIPSQSSLTDRSMTQQIPIGKLTQNKPTWSIAIPRVSGVLWMSFMLPVPFVFD